MLHDEARQPGMGLEYARNGLGVQESPQACAADVGRRADFADRLV